MPRKLTIVAVAGLSICVICLGAAAVIEVPHLKDRDWENFHFGFDACRPVPGATATSRSLDWTGGDTIRIAVPGEIRYHPGTDETIRASGDPQSIAHLRVRHHTLEFDCDGLHSRELRIALPGRAFRSFVVSGSGKLTLDGIDQPELDMAVAGSGAIRASAKAEKVKISIAGSGSVDADGTADRVRLRIAGSGDARLGRLAARAMEVKIAGSGDADIAPKEQADIKIAGSGNVRLATNPRTLDTKILGSGRIIHAAAP
jgi:hypothetical protein